MREIFIRVLEVAFFVTLTPPALYVLWKSRAYHD